MQRPGQQCGEQCSHPKAWRQMIHILPAVLVQRARLPDEQIAQDFMVGQHQQGAQGPAIQVDDQPRENQRHRRQAPAPGQAQHREHAQGGAGQGHAFLAAVQQARGIDCAGGKGQVGTGSHAQGGRFGNGVAQHLLEYHPGQGQGRAHQQADHQPWQKAVAHQQGGQILG